MVDYTSPAARITVRRTNLSEDIYEAELAQASNSALSEERAG